MSLYLPDPRWEMPELLTPGKKPSGSVVVDRSHPFAPTTVFLMQNNSILGKIPSDGFPTLNGSAEFGVYVGKQAVTLPTGAASSLRWRGPSDYASAYQLPSAKYSIMSICTIPANGVIRPTMHGGWSTRSGYGPSFWSDGANPTVYIADGSTFSSFSATGWTPLGTPESVVLTNDAVDGPKVYNRGALLGTGGTTLTTAPRLVNIGHIWAGVDTEANGFPLGGTIELVVIWEDQVLSAAEVSSLNRHPYQFLIPA